MKPSCNYHNVWAECYDLNLVPDPAAAAVVIGGGHVECGSSSRIERTGFKYHVIEFVTDGEGELILGAEKHPLYPGTLFSYGPDVVHEIRTTSAHSLTKHYVMFSGAELVNQLKAANLMAGPLHALYPVRLCTIFESLLEAGRSDRPYRSGLCVLLLKQLLLCIGDSAILPKVSRSPAWQTYLRVKKHIEQNFQSLRSLDQAAQECHINKSYLCHLFKRYSSETPLQMLTRLKMRRAADLMLTDPSLTFKRVAAEAGYPDYCYFSRVFKRVFGISPEAYIATFR